MYYRILKWLKKTFIGPDPPDFYTFECFQCKHYKRSKTPPIVMQTSWYYRYEFCKACYRSFQNMIED